MSGEDAFAAKVDVWVNQTSGRVTAVFRQATQQVVSQMQEQIPVDTGFARASIQASLSEMPLADAQNTNKKQAYPYDSGEVTLTIANATSDDTIYIGWTANYAIYLEYGHSQQAPSGFVRINAEQWPSIVADVSAQLKEQVG